MYVDAHAHLDKYGPELPEVLSEVEANKVFTISVSIDPDTYRRNKEISKRCALVLPTFGIHPWDAPKFAEKLPEFEALIADSPMVGEIGLDYRFVKNSESHVKQKKVFRHFVAKGVEQGKILNIHSSGAELDVASVLAELKARRVIMHWFSGTLEQLEHLTANGYFITIGVELLFNDHIQKIARAVPEQLLLTESDNPAGYQWLKGNKGKPSIMKEVVEKLAAVRGWSHQRTKELIFENFKRMAGPDAWASNLKFSG